MKEKVDWVSDRLSSATVLLYTEGSDPSFRPEGVADYLSEKIGITTISIRKGLPGLAAADLNTVSEALACARVTSPADPTPNSPFENEIRNERDRLMSDEAPRGIVYDGYALQRILANVLSEPGGSGNDVHICFTQRLLATFERPEMRYHLRTIVCGFPSIVSLPGLVEAPARSTEHYIEKRLWGEGMKERRTRTEDDHLGWNDIRTTHVATGYALQALAYWLWGDPFCSIPTCRLYNAHRQEGMLHAQLAGPDFCDEHLVLLVKSRRGSGELR